MKSETKKTFKTQTNFLILQENENAHWINGFLHLKNYKIGCKI
jgi:hypothetical protein